MSDRGTVEVIVKLTPEAAVRGSPQQERVEAQAAQLGLTLAPLHPSTSDPELAAYAVARVDAETADAAVEQLSRCNGIEGAYAKAEGSPPERRTLDGRQRH